MTDTVGWPAGRKLWMSSTHVLATSLRTRRAAVAPQFGVGRASHAPGAATVHGLVVTHTCSDGAPAACSCVSCSEADVSDPSTRMRKAAQLTSPLGPRAASKAAPGVPVGCWLHQPVSTIVAL